MSLTFQPGVRLRSRREYVAVQEHGRRISTRYLTMLALPNARSQHRLGIVASRRLGGAVVRNRVKRRLRDLFRHLEPDVLPQGICGLDLVVIAKRDAATAPTVALARDFRQAIGRVDARTTS